MYTSLSGGSPPKKSTSSLGGIRSYKLVCVPPLREEPLPTSLVCVPARREEGLPSSWSVYQAEGGGALLFTLLAPGIPWDTRISARIWEEKDIRSQILSTISNTEHSIFNQLAATQTQI
ncbi:uncharacterized protein PGTG_11782 [Puccinia graminis f. sp. tritici CRL 75-36-700-3]|uniref:Uncharacterized protein n=1 Tax=Puccinia graminis f. sp. tritici (strain CRL 75-36-700-3 / race SCCL) TaxID=418459 RepID=E3KMA1_PUCGT|nr:uncharacterized protein PGTG_11782 [Puccinia graminis f. sp. tritici CRL 75-36-700-3]EFP85426.1 hypothetical protein PGTG_11782 [Puccinia graminis f. sp. tritici CRL 75-36-700-3]